MAPTVGQIINYGGKTVLGALAVAGAAELISEIATGTIYPKNNQFLSTNILTFPWDLPSIIGQNFCMMFQFYQYNRPSILSSPTLTSYGTIVLPLPTDMLDSQSLQYDQGKAPNAAVGAALENASNIKQGLSNINSTESLLAAAGQGASAAAVGAAVTAAGNLAGQNAALGLQMVGLAQNPFLTILFNSPNFKRYSFNWTFIPENATDSVNLRNILDKFKYHSLPDVGEGTAGMLLTYPDMVVPKILPNPFMYDFKQCVIESVTVNYAPGATPAFFPGTNAPNAIKLTLNLLEIEYWVKSDLLKPEYHSTNFTTSGVNTNLNSGFVP